MHKKPHPLITRIPTFLLVALFAVCTLLAASYGLNTFLSIRENSDAIYASRTGMTYIATKLRQMNGKVSTAKDELIITSSINGEEYQTRIYLENGTLCESFGKAGSLSEVTQLVRATSFSCDLLSPQLLHFSLTDEAGHTNDMCIALNPGGVQ